MEHAIFPARMRSVASRERGISLVETMVGMAVGLAGMIVVMHSFTTSETYRRNLSGGADATQTAAIASARLEMLFQEGGAGLAQGRHIWGCRLLASRGGVALLPRASAWPEPFSGMPTTMRTVPIAILDGGTGSDVLAVMGADSGASNRDILITAVTSATGTDGAATHSLEVNNSIGLGLRGSAETPNDLLLVVPQMVAGDPPDCTVVQVAPTFSNGTVANDPSIGLNVVPSQPAVVSPASYTAIPLSSNYGAPSSANSPSAFHLGREAEPTFSLVSVNANGQLAEYDMLERRTPNLRVFGENVFLLKARYGLDNGASGGRPHDGFVDEWVTPTAWPLDSVMDGRFASEQKIDQIKAVRVALVTRSSQPVTTDAVTTQLTLFADLGATGRYVRELSSAEKRYQYQVFEWVVPLRNMKAVPKPA